MYDKLFPQLGRHCPKQGKTLLFHLLELSFRLLPFTISIFLLTCIFPIQCTSPDIQEME